MKCKECGGTGKVQLLTTIVDCKTCKEQALFTTPVPNQKSIVDKFHDSLRRIQEANTVKNTTESMFHLLNALSKQKPLAWPLHENIKIGESVYLTNKRTLTKYKKLGDIHLGILDAYSLTNGVIILHRFDGSYFDFQLNIIPFAELEYPVDFS